MKRLKISPILLPGALLLVTLACNLFSAVGSAPTATSLLPSPTIPVAAFPTPTSTNPPASEPTAGVPASSVPTTTAPTQAVVTEVPPAPTSRPSSGREYAVILVKDDDVLNVRKTAGANQAIVGKLSYNETGIKLTGKEQMAGKDRWVEIQQPLSGWVNAYFLSESIKPARFCSDQRVNKLLNVLGTAITSSDGNLLSSLVSPIHGLSLQYFHNGNVANYSSEEAKWVFNSDYVMNWGLHPASGLEVKGTFRKEVLPTLVEVFTSDYSLTCNQPEAGGASYSVSWPAQYTNINYYTIYKPGTPGTELDWRTYLAGVEYADGKPYLFALIHFFWEP